MGLNKQTFKPCGFCFVEYSKREEARLAIDCLNLVLLDRKRIRIDYDYGFRWGRRFGRGKLSGGQVRDDIAAQARLEAGEDGEEG
jgi:nuclear cap-binding protein subunit 2